MSLKRNALACLAAGILAACGGSTDGPKATDLVVTPNPVPLTSISQTQQLTAVVNDQNGDPMSGVAVSYASSASGTASVSGGGLVTAVAAGSATITATAAGLTENVAVTVTQVVSGVAKVSGDAQSALETTQLPGAIRVKVSDALGTGIAGVNVAFAVTGGGGAVSAPAVATNASGEAQVNWTLGAPGAQTATATVTGLTAVTFTATSVTNVPAAVAKVSGDAQSGVEGGQLPNPIRVKVTDSLGAAMAGVDVAFAAQDGGSVSAASVATNAAGEAQVTWTLGAGTGAQTATATVTGLTPLMFTATASSASILTITKHVGDAQTALVGYATNVRPAVRIVNALAQPQAGVNVTFAVTGGGGSVTGSATIATNADGIAQVENWVVGGSAGANTLTATGAGTYGGANNVAFAATGQTAQFNIVIRNTGPAFRPEVQAAFDSAEARWERVIYGDLQNIQFTGQTDVCFIGNTMNEVVDDMLILASFDSIDGPFQILGSAGDCGYYRTVDGLAMIGRMSFDSADAQLMIDSGTLADVILHEMGHVLGFSGWNFDLALQSGFTRNCIDLQTSGDPPSVVSQDTHFTCAMGRAMFDSIGGTNYTGGLKVPLENCASGVPASCDSGTYNGHWREPTFGTELMTGYIGGPGNPLSRLTIAALGDLGYRVNLAAASTYTRTFTAPAFAQGPLLFLGNDIYVAPVIHWIDPSGRVVAVTRR